MATKVYALPEYVTLVKAVLLVEGLYEIEVSENRWLNSKHPIIAVGEIPNPFDKPVDLLFGLPKQEPVDERVIDVLKNAFQHREHAGG